MSLEAIQLMYDSDSDYDSDREEKFCGFGSIDSADPYKKYTESTRRSWVMYLHRFNETCFGHDDA